MNDRNCLYFLDFDGVICDSIRECFVSSWYAYYRHLDTEPPYFISLDHKKAFYSARPFIRIGEDYVLLHDLILSGKSVKNQYDFDNFREERGKTLLDEYKRSLLEVRENAIETHKADWIGLHSLYDGLFPLLTRAASDRAFFILSTKKASLIAEILGAFGIHWPPERILYSGSGNKNDFILNLIAREGAGGAVFIDDQKDHFTHITDMRIRCFLATWGYIQTEWLAEKDMEFLSLDEFRNLLSVHLSQ